MARDGSGDFTYPPGEGDVVSGTTIETTWNNDSYAETAAGLTDSLSRSGNGVMSAPLLAIDGDQGGVGPGLAFSAESSTGWRRDGAGDIVFQLSGTNLVRYNAGKMYVWTGGTTWSEVTSSATPTSGFSGFGDGTETDPGAYFASELSSGLWLNTAQGAGVVSLSSFGIESMRWNNGTAEVENANSDAWYPVVGLANPSTTDETMRWDGTDWVSTTAIKVSGTGTVTLTGATAADSLETTGNITTTGGIFVGDGAGLTNLPTGGTSVDPGTLTGQSLFWNNSTLTWENNAAVTFDGSTLDVTGAVDATGAITAASFSGVGSSLTSVNATTFNNLSSTSYAKTGTSGTQNVYGTHYGDGSNLTGVKATKTVVGRVSAAGGTVYDPDNAWGVSRTGEGLYTLTFSAGASPSTAQALTVSVEGATFGTTGGGILVTQTASNKWDVNTFYVTGAGAANQDLGFSFVRHYT